MIESTQSTVTASAAKAEVNKLSSPGDSGINSQATDSNGKKFPETLDSHLHELSGDEEIVLPETILAEQQPLPEGKELPPLPPTAESTGIVQPHLADADLELQSGEDDTAIVTALPLILQQQAIDEAQPEVSIGKVSTPVQQHAQIPATAAENIQTASLLATDTTAAAASTDFTDSSIEVMKPSLQKSDAPAELTAILNTGTNPRLTTVAPLNSVAGTVKLSIDAPLQQGQWADNLAGRVSWMAMNNQHSAQISLNPAELGPIEVMVRLNHDQASVNFFAHNQLVRDAIQDAFPKLQHMMNENGLNLSQSSVSDQSLSQRQAHAEPGQQQQSYYPFEETTELQAGQNGRLVISKLSLVDQFV